MPDLNDKSFLRRAYPLFFLSLMLRPLVTAIGPVMPEIRSEFGFSAAQGSLLTTLPVVCFGLGSFVVPRLLSRISPNKLIIIVFIILTIGGLVRTIPNEPALLIGTVFIGIGIAFGNVVMSVISRRDFPERIGWITGVVTGGISVSASIAAWSSFPLSDSTGSWRVPTLIWALLPILALLSWFTYRSPVADEPITVHFSIRKVARNPIAWGLLFYFGLQSTMFYSMATWLPTILRDSGLTPSLAGTYSAYLTVLGVPTGLFVPPLIAKAKNQVVFAITFSALALVGLIGLLQSPTSLTFIWVTCLGISVGSTFPLALTLVLLRSDSPSTARDLQTMMQGGGYFISAVGPFILGALRDNFDGWTAALTMLVVVVIIQGLLGAFVSRPIVVHED